MNKLVFGDLNCLVMVYKADIKALVEEKSQLLAAMSECVYSDDEETLAALEREIKALRIKVSILREELRFLRGELRSGNF